MNSGRVRPHASLALPPSCCIQGLSALESVQMIVSSPCSRCQRILRHRRNQYAGSGKPGDVHDTAESTYGGWWGIRMRSSSATTGSGCHRDPFSRTPRLLAKRRRWRQRSCKPIHRAGPHTPRGTNQRTKTLHLPNCGIISYVTDCVSGRKIGSE